MAERPCRICGDPIPDSRHPNAVTCNEVCGAENDRRNRNRDKRRTYRRRRAAALAAREAAAASA